MADFSNKRSHDLSVDLKNVEDAGACAHDELAPCAALNTKPNFGVGNVFVIIAHIVNAIPVGAAIPGIAQKFPCGGQAGTLRICRKKAPANC